MKSGKPPKYRKVEPKLWGSRAFRSLSPMQPCGAGLFLRLLTGPEMSAVPGLVVGAGEAALAEALRWPLKGFRAAFAELEKAELARADNEARLIWLPDQLVAPENPNVAKHWAHVLDEAADSPLREEVITAVINIVASRGESFLQPFRERFPERFKEPFEQRLTEPSHGSFRNPDPDPEPKPEPDPPAGGRARAPADARTRARESELPPASRQRSSPGPRADERVGPESAKRRGLAQRRYDEPFVAEAFAAGVRAATGAAYVVPSGERRDLDDAVDAHCPHPAGSELRDAWITESVAKFRRAILGREHFNGMGGPSGWLRWVNAGARETLPSPRAASMLRQPAPPDAPWLRLENCRSIFDDEPVAELAR